MAFWGKEMKKTEAEGSLFGVPSGKSTYAVVCTVCMKPSV